MIQLYQFPPAWNVPNVSQFCMKVEIFLRMADLDYQTVHLSDPTKAPKGKLPYIQDGDKTVADSSLIITYLENNYNINLDRNLDPSEKAVSHAFQKMLEERFYWFVLYSRWMDERCWPEVEKLWFGELSPIFKLFVPKMIRNQVSKALYMQGTGRHSAEEIYQLAAKDIKALSDFLGDKQFMMSNEPTKLDSTAYAFISNIYDVHLDSPIKVEASKYENLKAYNSRMKQKYFANTQI